MLFGFFGMVHLEKSLSARAKDCLDYSDYLGVSRLNSCEIEGTGRVTSLV